MFQKHCNALVTSW